MNATSEIAPELLARIKIFHRVSPEVLEGILATCTVRLLEAGEVLIVPGEENRYVYVLLDGRLRVHLDSKDREPFIILEPGETVGEMSVIDRQPTSAYVVAETACRLLVLTEEILWSLVQVSHAAACNLLCILSTRLRNADNAIFERLQTEEAYNQYGNVDALTGLRSRHWLDTMLSRQLNRSFRSSRPLSVIMTDIDNFKQFNDRFGHLAGDRAIHTVAQVLLDNLRPNEMAARYGGDEFVVLLPDVCLAEAVRAAERLRRRVMKARMEPEAGTTSSLTISLGVAQAQPGQSVTDLLAAVDAALYRAKENGRNLLSE